MADLKASMILQFGEPVFGRITLPKKTAADDIQKGDFLKSTGATGVEKMTGPTDDATFVGVSAVQSKDADGPQTILIYMRCIVECPMTSASYAFGAGLKYKTDGTLVSDGSAADTIAWAWETKTTVTSLKCLVDVMALGKLFAVSA